MISNQRLNRESIIIIKSSATKLVLSRYFYFPMDPMRVRSKTKNSDKCESHSDTAGSVTNLYRYIYTLRLAYRPGASRKFIILYLPKKISNYFLFVVNKEERSGIFEFFHKLAISKHRRVQKSLWNFLIPSF